MKLLDIWLKRLALGSLITCLVVTVRYSVCAAVPAAKKVHKLEFQGSGLAPLNQDRLTIIQADGKSKEIPIVLEVSRYEITLARVNDGETVPGWPQRIYCLTLRSTDSRTPYSWSWWTSDAFGHVRLIRSDDKGYLTWVEGFVVSFADVSKANDKMASLEQTLSHGKASDIVRVPVYRVLPESRLWGVNAHYRDITVRSIAKDQSGNWVLQISGPKSDKVYSLVSDKTTEIGWRLQE